MEILEKELRVLDEILNLVFDVFWKQNIIIPKDTIRLYVKKWAKENPDLARLFLLNLYTTLYKHFKSLT